MSARAMLQAVEMRLRSSAILDDPTGRICGVQPSGKPPPVFGQVYYAIWWPGTRLRQDHSVAEQEDKGVEVTVTITGRMGGVPTDRKGKVISTMSATGKDYLNLYLIDLAEYIAIDDPKVIHANYEDVMNVANSLIIGTEEYSAAHGNIPPVTTNGFVEPLQLLGYGPVVEQPASWIRSENS